jgi:hypothetical protein
MTLRLPRGIPKDAVLPLGFAALGASYFALTYLRRPPLPALPFGPVRLNDLHALAEWERHARDARFALFAGLGAGGVLWFLRKSGRGVGSSRQVRDSLA